MYFKFKKFLDAEGVVQYNFLVKEADMTTETLELRTSDNHCITSIEELQEVLETCLDRFSAAEVVNTIREFEETPEFDEESCLDYLCENCDFSAGIEELTDMADEISEAVSALPGTGEICEKLRDLREKLSSITVLY